MIIGVAEKENVSKLPPLPIYEKIPTSEILQNIIIKGTSFRETDFYHLIFANKTVSHYCLDKFHVSKPR